MAAILVFAGATARAADCPWKPDSPAAKGEKIDYYLAPFPNLSSRVVWGRSVHAPDGGGLAFGGQDQRGEDGIGHTCLREGGNWISLVDELRAANPLQALHDRLRAASRTQHDIAARLRYIYFQGAPAAAQAAAIAKEVAPAEAKLAQALTAIDTELGHAAGGATPYLVAQAKIARDRIGAALAAIRGIRFDTGAPASADTIRVLHKLIIDIDRAADPIGAEPPPRVASPIAYDTKTGLYVLFGGDHFDYLMNDTWVFDPKQRRWLERHPTAAPTPRTLHKWNAPGDGTVEMEGGLVYSNESTYKSHQYIPIKDGAWRYDIATDSWSGPRPAGEPDRRQYHKGLYLPDAFLNGPRPDAAAGEARLAALPPNTWVALNPKPLPIMNRDWGTTVIDPDHDLLLRWSGGHDAHNGSDVLHYHPATNRWELPIPIELPFGTIFSWDVPFGVNFNRRPWLSFHTYRSYAYDRDARALVWEGRGREVYLYDPVRAEWTDRQVPPKEMAGGWKATVEGGAAGTFLLDTKGRLWRYEAKQRTWRALELHGVKLPVSKADHTIVSYDRLRNRLVIARYDAELYAVDLATANVTRLNPAHKPPPPGFSITAFMAHDQHHDLMLVGAITAQDGPGRMPAYDPVGNRWITLKVGGANPYKTTSNDYLISLGLIYDAKRDLFWTVDHRSRVFALRLDPEKADIRPLAASQ